MNKIFFFFPLFLFLVAFWLSIDDEHANSFTLYQLSDISEFRPQDGIRYSNILPKKYTIEGSHIVSRVLNNKQIHKTCLIENIKNWRCEEGNWNFGIENGAYFSNALPEENIVVTKIQYSLNWCRWYLKEGIIPFVTKCPLNILFDP